jgi:hypothetical protein
MASSLSRSSISRPSAKSSPSAPIRVETIARAKPRASTSFSRVPPPMSIGQHTMRVRA